MTSDRISQAMQAKAEEQKRRADELIAKYGVVGANGIGFYICPDCIDPSHGVEMCKLDTRRESLREMRSNFLFITMEDLPAVISKLQSFLPPGPPEATHKCLECGEEGDIEHFSDRSGMPAPLTCPKCHSDTISQ